MPQRQFRPGDVLDDYCPRERRLTDHAIVAMVEGAIQRTRCVSCDAEHEYREAKLPPPRRRTSTAALVAQVIEAAEAPVRRDAVPAAAALHPPPEPAAADPPAVVAAASGPGPAAAPDAEDRPFRRSLIRAQLPRPEGQPPPARAIPEFTMHQPQNLRARRHGQRGMRRRPGGGTDAAAPPWLGRDAGSRPASGQGKRRRRRRKP